MLLLLWISWVTMKDWEFQIFLQNIAVLKLFGLPNLVQRHEYYYILFFNTDKLASSIGNEKWEGKSSV